MAPAGTPDDTAHAHVVPPQKVLRRKRGVAPAPTPAPAGGAEAPDNVAATLVQQAAQSGGGTSQVNVARGGGTTSQVSTSTGGGGVTQVSSDGELGRRDPAALIASGEASSQLVRDYW